jgi:hypothetical protein
MITRFKLDYECSLHDELKIPTANSFVAEPPSFRINFEPTTPCRLLTIFFFVLLFIGVQGRDTGGMWAPIVCSNVAYRVVPL